MSKNVKFSLLTAGLIVLILVIFMLKPFFYFMFLHLFLPDKTEHIRVNELKKMSQDTVLLLDTRSYEEYEVSHLKDARWVGFEDFSVNKIDSLPKNTTIVLYCSVGYRSDLVGNQLKDAGYHNVYNLWGGIFAWTNRGLPLYAQDTLTTQIHPYSTAWGFWLSRGNKTYGSLQKKPPSNVN